MLRSILPSIFGHRSLTNLTRSLLSTKKSHIVGPSLLSPLIEEPLPQLLDRITNLYPQRPLVHSYQQGRSLTYQQLYEKSVQLANGFIQVLNLKPNDRIGLYSYNKEQWIVVQMAAALAGLILVNVNPAYQAQELAYTINKVQMKVLIISDLFKKSSYLDIVKKVVPGIEKATNPWDINVSTVPSLKAVIRLDNPDQQQTGFGHLCSLFTGSKSTNKLPIHKDAHAVANIQFTSGTTGLPKAAALTHLNILNNAYEIGRRCNYTKQDNIAVPVPFYHCFGMIMGTLAAVTRGAAITIVCEGFDPVKTLEAVSKYRCTSLYGVPTMFIEYLRQLEAKPQGHYSIKQLRTGIIAGALCPEVLMTKIIDKMYLKDITNCYGMTETSPVTFQTSPSDSMARKTTTVGTILSGLEAKIVDKDGNVCQRGQSGQFCLKGWAVMKGYWGDSKATNASIVDGWMKSGDLAVLDDEGYLSIVGRIKDMIIRGGENVYPKQIEDFLRGMTGVIDVQVVAVSDDKYGEEIAAVIKVNDPSNTAITKDAVVKYCRGRIAHYKIPRYVKVITELPLTVTGKPQKFLMRQELEDQKRSGVINVYDTLK